MEQLIENIATSTDYTTFLQRWEVTPSINGHYLQVGNPISEKGWILHLSVVLPEIPALLEKIFPILISEQVPFKIPRNEETANALLSGFLGYHAIGKIVGIYPGSPERASRLAAILIEQTREFKGPSVPTDYHLGGVLYARYGNPQPSTPDDYKIPFVLPSSVKWPFTALKPYKKKKTKRLLNGRYLTAAIIKNDAKGRVIRAFDFHKWINIRYCIIKEGVKYMSYDIIGRDIRDRLSWQYELHKELANIIDTPKALDLFERDGNVYFVMEHVQGITLSEVINHTYEGDHWVNLSQEQQKMLIGIFQTILDHVQKMHEKGYFHRDLNPRNFIVTPEGRLVCIDLELAYYYRDQKPYPPYVLGTPGYMSPEQATQEEPTVAQDIYGLGGLMVRIFTGLSPKLFAIEDSETLADSLFFLMGHKGLANLACACLSHHSEERPDLVAIHQFMEAFEKENMYRNTAAKLRIEKVSHESYVETIQRAINCLGSLKLSTTDHVWFSKPSNHVKQLSNEMFETTYSMGAYSGVSGVFYLLSLAQAVGYGTSACSKQQAASWNYLQYCMQNIPVSSQPGLFTGYAGVFLSLIKSVEAGLIEIPENYLTDLFQESLYRDLPELNIASGISGQGLVLLQCTHILPKTTLLEILFKKAQQILAAQQKDGSWIITSGEGNRRLKLFSLSYGIAGIIYFLLKCYEYTNDPSTLTGAIKGLSFLEKQAGQSMVWATYPKGPGGNAWLDYGSTGIVLPFMKAYALTGEKRYKSISTISLSQHKSPLLSPYLALGSGIAGIGEIYLEASRIFGDEEWKARADWIAQFLVHMASPQPDGSLCWITDNSTLPTADLMDGSSGIIHFLMRNIHPEKISLPLLY